MLAAADGSTAAIAIHRAFAAGRTPDRGHDLLDAWVTNVGPDR